MIGLLTNMNSVKRFNVILARSINGGIGLKGGLPWNSKKDMDFFKKVTSFTPIESLKNVVIMGRKTMESLPKQYLPNRLNIVVSSQELNNENIITAKTFDEAINLANNMNHYNTWVIGGKSIYEQAFNHYLVGNIYHTELEKEFECDTFLNIPPEVKWYSETLDKDDANDYKMKFQIGKLNQGETQYLHLMSEIMNIGEKKNGRNGYTYSLFGKELKFDLAEGFPLLTTKRMFWKGIVEELLFFIRGDTNSKLLEEKGVNIWKGNTTKEFIEKCGLPYEEGDMGCIYGFNWRHFGADYKDCKTDYNGKGYDQLAKIVNEIKTDPNSRRIVMSDFNPATAHMGVLYPCHSLILQFYVENGNNLSVKMYQRSVDTALGLPFNIASTALLLHIIAKLTNMNAKNVILTLGDCHLYDEHMDKFKKQLERVPYKFPNLVIPDFKTIEEVENSKFVDYVIDDYVYHAGIKAGMVA